MGEEYIHWNVRGINDKLRRKGKVSKIISLLQKPQDTVLINLQETHLQSNEDIPPKFYEYKHLYHIIPSFASPGDSGSGILIFVNKREEVILREELVKGRIVILKICNCATKEIKTIISIYGKSTNDKRTWSEQFNKINDYIIDNNLENIYFLGDFNFVTSTLDRNSHTLNSIDELAGDSWKNLEASLDIADSFRVNNPSKIAYSYTHTNKVSRSRLDRFYVPTYIASRPVSHIFEASHFSDHKIIRLKVTDKVEMGEGHWVFNDMMLNDADFVTLMTSTIQDMEHYKQDFANRQDFFDDIKQTIHSTSRAYAINRAKKKRMEKFELKNERERIERISKHRLTDLDLHKLNNISDKEKELESEALHGAKIRAKTPLFEFGEPSISFLKKLEKASGEKNCIFSLEDDKGNLKQGKEEIISICHTFYKNLYTKEPEDESAQDTLLSKINVKVQNEHSLILEKDITERDLHQALRELKPNKAPGPDGLTRAFYLKFWDVLKHNYIESIKETLREDELSEMQKRGAIRISHKKGDRTKLGNYRPITLLNVDLKILSRLLSKRLSLVLASLIHENQKCVPGRHITDNIHLIQDLIDWINNNGEAAALLLFDQEKAFDRLSHHFLFKTLQAFGFGGNFIKWVKILLFDIKSFVRINGFETEELPVERGVRQGCPLSPLLYVLAAEVLASNIIQNSLIRGYSFGLNEFKAGQYADDLITCITHLDSIDELFSTISMYERATNSKLNISKSKGLWVGKWRDNPKDLKGMEWSKDYVNLTGVYVGNRTTKEQYKRLSDLNFDEIKVKIDKSLKFWTGNKLSIKGKIIVANNFILTKLFYRLECVDITILKVKEIETLIFNFIWGKTVAGRVNRNVLFLDYKAGGLQLYDIIERMKCFRVKWIRSLLDLEKSDFLRTIVDNLIGNFKGIVGLKMLHHSIQTKFEIKSIFYERSISIWNSMKIEPDISGHIYLKEEILFQNPLFIDDNGNMFKFPNSSNKKVYMPNKFQDLPVSVPITKINPNHRHLISSLNKCFWKLNNNPTEGKSQYIYMLETIRTDILDISLKNLYRNQISLRKVDMKWVDKWKKYFVLTDVVWENIWLTLHDSTHSYKIQSGMWEMLHLNYYCSYKAHKYYNEENRCKLCGEAEADSFHIILSCPVHNDIFRRFNDTFKEINGKDLSEREVIFGCQEPGDRINLRNFLTFIIKNSIFRMRNTNFVNKQIAEIAVLNRIHKDLKSELNKKLLLYTSRNKIARFKDLFLYNNILGHVVNNEFVYTLEIA